MIENDFRKNLMKDDCAVYYATINSLALKLGLFNESFLDFIKSPYKLAKYLDVSKVNVDEFYQKVRKYYNTDITDALKRLEKNKILIFEEYYVGIFPDGEIQKVLVTIKDEFGDEKIETQLHYDDTYERKLTDYEKDVFVEIETKTLLDFNCGDFSEFLSKFYSRRDEFYKIRNQRLFDKIECFNVYKKYEIRFTPQFVFNRKKSIENNLSLNKLFVDRVLNNKF